MPETESERQAVREQLERVLLSPVFKNTKRYSNLLRFIVERTLEGRSDSLKERTVGVEVFGRAPDYDTNTDHVVRSAAGEIRKRLAQYYQEPGCESAIRIDVHPGSYIPHFRLAQKPVAEPIVLLEIPKPRAAGSLNPYSWFHFAGWRMVAASAVAGVAALGALGFGMWSRAHSATVLDRFWNPVVSCGGQTLLCVGTRRPAAEPPVTVSDLDNTGVQQVHIADATTLARLAGLLQAKGARYRVQARAATTFSDLQDGPVVFIGGLNNAWTVRAAGTLRFCYTKGQDNSACVSDSRNLSRQEWCVNFSLPYAELTRDYALVSRVRDPKTDQVFVIAGGISHWGTFAAGEFLTNEAYLKKIEANAPGDWDRKNLQVVLSTDVVSGSSGPPNIMAAYFW